MLEFLDAQPKLEYVVAMAKNALLKRVVESGMRRARQLSRRSGKTEHIYGEVRYKAGKWPGLRRVIIKAEVVRAADKDPKDNPRFVITNMKQSPQWIYERVYCQRGDIENRIKELHELEIDRTSCTSFWANQFRVLLTAAAYVLMQELRLRAAGTACARAQVGTLRERLAEARRSGLGLGTTRRRPSARFLPVSTRLPSCGSGARRGNRLNPFSGLPAQPNSTPTTVTAPPVSPSSNLNIPILELFDPFAPLPDQPQLSGFTTHFAPMTGRWRCLHE